MNIFSESGKFISIIVTVYNLERYINKTLDSLVTQDIEKFEVILIDDGSTDKSVAIASDILKKIPQLDYKIINKKNGGVSSARNLGLLNSKGKYVMFLDGDDYVSSSLIETLDSIRNDEPDVICWQMDTVSEDGNIIHSYSTQYAMKPGTINGLTALENIISNKTLWIWTGSALYKRDMLINNCLLYSEGCDNGEDQEFTFKVLVYSSQVKYLETVLSYYVIRDGSITNSYNIKKFDVINAFRRVLEFLNNLNNGQLDKLINVFENEYLINNYIYNLDVSLLWNNGQKKSLTEIVKDIDMNYPGLNKYIFNIMSKYQGKDIKMLIKIRVFLMSYRLYNRMMKSIFLLKKYKI